MTTLARATTIGCALFAGVALAPMCRAQTPPVAEQIAKTYGVESFKTIDAIRFTFNAELGDLQLSRSWVWQPKTGQVSYAGKDKDGKPVTATYVQSQLDAAPANVRDEINPAFVNDEYNLLFPLQSYWDGAPVRDLGTQKLPLGDGSAKEVVVDYSPGDIWELYVGPDNRIEAFVFRRGGPRKPSVVIATWAGYQKAGPLLIATDRRGTADGKPVRIFMTDLAVKLAGSDAWVNAQ